MRGVALTTMLILLAMSVVAWQWQPDAPPPGKTKLVWVTDDNPARQAQIALFEKLYPDCDLHLDPSNYSLDKIIVQSMAGVGPDLFDSFGASYLEVFVKAGIAWDVTDELRKAGIDPIADTWKVSHDSFIRNGRVYGFPTNAGVAVMLYNKDVFDKAGIPYPKGPWKWTKDLVPLAKKLTLRDNKGKIIQYGMLSPWGHWEQFIRQWGGSIYSKDGTHCTIDSPEAIEAVQFMHDLVYKYQVAPTPVAESAMATQGGWGSGNISFFGAHKAAMTVGNRYWLCSLRNYKNFRMGAVECPYERVRVFLGGSRVTLINAKSPRRREAVKFLKFLASRPYNELINHQADWLAPVKRYCFTDLYLHDPEFPEEDYNEVWRDVMKYGITGQISPFVNSAVASRIIASQLGLVYANEKSPADAMKTAARQINAEIAKTLKRDPQLRRLYQRLTKKRVL
ncbi:MAG: sugar ABC transporter substrate-binding protein [Armatimonadetes bacterium]|nr:sugar ABC transporter substrate-binding protein [Armatimonadota bacterium]